MFRVCVRAAIFGRSFMKESRAPLLGCRPAGAPPHDWGTGEEVRRSQHQADSARGPALAGLALAYAGSPHRKSSIAAVFVLVGFLRCIRCIRLIFHHFLYFHIFPLFPLFPVFACGISTMSLFPVFATILIFQFSRISHTIIHNILHHNEYKMTKMTK